jgi:hypothetical protein
MCRASTIQHILQSKGLIGCLVSFFFVQLDNNDSLNAQTVLRSLLRQRLNEMKIPQKLEEKLRKIVTSPDESDLLELLCEVMSTPRKSYIVIDGLDECDEENRKKLLRALKTVASSSKNIHLYLSSRASLRDEVDKYFPVSEHLSLDCQATNNDIASYIEGILNEKIQDDELKVGDTELVQEVKKALVNGAQGM